MKRRVTIASAVFAVSVALLYQIGCGSSPAAPVNPPGGGGGSAAVTITIVGMNGGLSFSPNPASVAIGGTVAFRNADSTTHHIVQDGGAFDTGDLAPGATSAAITISSGSPFPYHCTIHPSMVGSINGSSSGPGGPGY
jgi:plastocyanin